MRAVLHAVGGARQDGRIARRLRLALLLVLALTGCGAVTLRASEAAPAPGERPARVPPLQDRRGLHPGLTVVASADRAAARAVIDAVAVRERDRSGPDYDRDAFGEAWTDDADATWGHDGCRTREEVLHRDLRAPTFRAGTDDCVVLDGLLDEPYTGRTIEFSKSRPTEVQIDHVIPLAMAWRQGASGWSEARRTAFANDPLELLAVDGQANQEKSSAGPAAWLPPRRAVRCAYAVRVALVAARYDLGLPRADRRAMARQCA